MGKDKVILKAESTLVFQPLLAKKVGLNGAIVLQQVHYWLEQKRTRKEPQQDGRHWVYNSFSKWGEQFPFWSERTIKRTFAELEKSGLLLTGNYNKRGFDRTKWYSIDYEKLHELMNLQAEEEKTTTGK